MVNQYGFQRAGSEMHLYAYLYISIKSIMWQQLKCLKTSKHGQEVKLDLCLFLNVVPGQNSV